MSADILRAAAKAARDEWSSETSGPFKNAARIHLAVADWLDRVSQPTYCASPGESTSALTIARAYLGESA